MKKFAGRPKKINTDVIGLDVHKDVTAFSHLDAQGAEAHSGEVASTEAAVLELVTRLSSLAPGGAVHVAMEASGGMLWLYDLLVARLGEKHVHVAQPQRIRAIANSAEKNDANDAYWLAYYTFEGRLPEAWIPTGRLRELRVVTRARREAVRMRSRAIQVLKSHLRQMGERLPGRRMDADIVRARAHELAAQTPGLLGTVLRRTLARFEAAEKDAAAYEGEIAELAQDMPAVETLQRKVPGVGPTLAAVIVAEAGPMERFKTPKAFGKFTGMTPADRSTGGRTIHGRMTRQGSAHLRWALGQAVMSCLRSSRDLGSGPRGAVARWVDAKAQRTSGPGKVRVAAARKLATSIWWLFHHPERYDAYAPFQSAPARV